jgi:hypothetical protein
MRWGEFASVRPDLAGAARELLYQFGVGLAFLATVRRDGGPRVHPFCPIVTDTGLYAFLIPSPKRDDLARDGRYAIHSFPPDDTEDAIYLVGAAHGVDGPGLRGPLATRFMEERAMTEPPPGFDAQHLFEFDIARCLLTRTTGHGDPRPVHTVWAGG